MPPQVRQSSRSKAASPLAQGLSVLCFLCALCENQKKGQREGEHFHEQGWRFEVVDMDGRKIDKLLANRVPDAGEAK